MKTYSLCLVLLFAAVANAAVPDRPDNNVNEVHHDFQEDIHLMENEDDMKILNIIEEEELLGNYDDPDEDYYDEDHDEDDEDQDWASGNDYDDEDEEWLDDKEKEDDITLDDDKDEEWLDDYEEEDDITLDDDKEWLDDYEEEDDITFDDDKDDILNEYHTEDYEGTGYYDFFKEIEDVTYQPPLAQIRDHGKPDKEDETVAELSVPTSRNLLVSSLLFASGLASFALFTLAFIMYLCIRRRRDSISAKKAQLPFVIQHSSGSSPLHSSIIKPGKYQPVATQENRSNHGIENDNSLLKQQTQLEEKLLP